MCMGGGLSIVLGLRELRLEGLAADERVLVGDGKSGSAGAFSLACAAPSAARSRRTPDRPRVPPRRRNP